mgnify:CR=1 FL=1
MLRSHGRRLHYTHPPRQSMHSELSRGRTIYTVLLCKRWLWSTGILCLFLLSSENWIYTTQKKSKIFYTCTHRSVIYCASFHQNSHLYVRDTKNIHTCKILLVICQEFCLYCRAQCNIISYNWTVRAHAYVSGVKKSWTFKWQFLTFKKTFPKNHKSIMLIYKTFLTFLWEKTFPTCVNWKQSKTPCGASPYAVTGSMDLPSFTIATLGLGAGALAAETSLSLPLSRLLHC